MSNKKPNLHPIVGSPAPDFDLRTPFGVVVRLTDCLREGPVLIDFIRGTWDPDARRRLKALGEARERLQERKARILVVTCERSSTAMAYLQEHPSPLRLLIDPTRDVARRYGVLQRFSFPVWNVARPSSFLVDRCGFVRYSFVARLQIHSADLEDVRKALEKI